MRRLVYQVWGIKPNDNSFTYQLLSQSDSWEIAVKKEALYNKQGYFNVCIEEVEED